MRYHDPNYQYGSLPYAQRDLAQPAGFGIGLVLLVPFVTAAVIVMLAWKVVAWGFKRLVQ